MTHKCAIKSDSLWLGTIAYLALPIGIFAIGWLNPVWAILLIASLAVGMYFRTKPEEEISPSVPMWSLLLLACGCIALCVFAGVGGFAYQDGDYFKHNSVVTDLFRRDWPVAYQIEHGGTKHPVALIYYFAYYLPPALIGKLAGWEALRYAMVLWTASGLFLMCLWCLKFTNGALWSPLVFLAFGGFDVLGMALEMKVFHWMPDLWIEHRQMEWWTGFSFGNYSSLSNHLFWAPQHAIPGWLITAATLHRIRSGTLAGCALFVAMSTLWSPFIAIGLIPIGMVGFVIARGKGTFDYSNLASIPLFIIGGLFIAARGVPNIPFSEIPNDWNDLNPLKLGFTFGLEVLPWGLLLLWSYRADKANRLILTSCVIFLAILPIWKMGTFNDLMMRASLPAFTALTLLFLHAVVRESGLWKKIALITLIFGSGGLAFDVIRHVEFLGSRAAQIDFTSPSKVPSLPATPDLSGLLDQYLGSPESTFNRHLARPLPLVNDSVPYNGEAPPEGVIAKQNRMQLDLRHRFDHGERSLDFLREYGTISYYQGDLWESMLAFET